MRVRISPPLPSWPRSPTGRGGGLRGRSVSVRLRPEQPDRGLWRNWQTRCVQTAVVPGSTPGRPTIWPCHLVVGWRTFTPLTWVRFPPGSPGRGGSAIGEASGLLTRGRQRPAGSTPASSASPSAFSVPRGTLLTSPPPNKYDTLPPDGAAPAYHPPRPIDAPTLSRVWSSAGPLHLLGGW